MRTSNFIYKDHLIDRLCEHRITPYKACVAKQISTWPMIQTSACIITQRSGKLDIELLRYRDTEHEEKDEVWIWIFF